MLAENIDRISELIPSEGFAVTHAEARQPWHQTHLDFDALDLEGVEVLYVVGVGDGEILRSARRWLSPEHRLVILAEEVEVMRWLLDHPLDPEIEVHPLCVEEENEPLYHWLQHRYGLSNIAVAITPGYDGEAVARRLQADAARARFAYSEHLDYGRPFFQNLWPNARLLPECYDATPLFGAYANVPAVICGAGPSLDPQALDRNRALILAGGSALKSVQPHFGAAIDPNPEEEQILAGQTAPLFFRTRLHHGALANYGGPRLLVPGSSYPAGNWFEAELGIADADLEEGINVVTFLTSIALKLGCNPIVFHGVDLAARDNLPGDAFLDFDVRMRPVYTTHEWQTAAEWLGALAAEHPDVQFLNASEGIPIPGVEYVLLAEVDLGERPRVALPGRQKLAVSADQVHWACQAMADSLARCERLARSGDPLSQFELEEEIAYRHLLQPLLTTYKRFRVGDPLAFAARAAKVNFQWIQAS